MRLILDLRPQMWVTSLLYKNIYIVYSRMRCYIINKKRTIQGLTENPSRSIREAIDLRFYHFYYYCCYHVITPALPSRVANYVS